MGITYYHSKEEKKTKGEKITEHGLSVIHTDFVDENGNPTGGKTGRLIYGTEEQRIESIEKEFTIHSGDFFFELESVKTLVEVYPLMYDVYDKAITKQIGEKLGIDVKGKTSEQLQSLYHFRIAQKLQYLKPEQKKEFIPDDLEKLMIVTSKNKMFLPRSKSFVNEMALIYLVAIFHAYITEIMHTVFKYHRSLLKSAKSDFSYSDIINQNNETMFEKLSHDYTKEIVNRGTKNLAKKFKFIFDFSLPAEDWEEFIERFERRNILIHNEGIPNEQYKKRFPQYASLRKLEITNEYLLKSFKLFERYVMRINNFFWKKYGESLYLEQMTKNNVI